MQALAVPAREPDPARVDADLGEAWRWLCERATHAPMIEPSGRCVKPLGLVVDGG